jgi:hypothetical protein
MCQKNTVGAPILLKIWTICQKRALTIRQVQPQRLYRKGLAQKRLLPATGAHAPAGRMGDIERMLAAQTFFVQIASALVQRSK